MPCHNYNAVSVLLSLLSRALHNNRLDSLEQAVFDDTLRLESLYVSIPFGIASSVLLLVLSSFRYLHGNQITDLSNAPFRTVRQLKKL